MSCTLQDSYITNKHLKQCLNSLVIERIQIKTTVRYHYIATRFTKIFVLIKINNKDGHFHLFHPKAMTTKAKINK